MWTTVKSGTLHWQGEVAEQPKNLRKETNRQTRCRHFALLYLGTMDRGQASSLSLWEARGRPSPQYFEELCADSTPHQVFGRKFRSERQPCFLWNPEYTSGIGTVLCLGGSQPG